MTGGFNVSTHELRTHSSTVSGIAGSVGEAASAAATERAGGTVYGELFDHLALHFLNDWADHIQSLISSNQQVGDAIAAGLKNNAENYEQAEHTNKTGIHKSGQEGGH